MPINFTPRYTITSKIMRDLLQIEAIKEKVLHLPLTPKVLASLRETARLYTTHYSTMIEGNRLSPGEIEDVLMHEGHFPGRERDEGEVKGYYAALAQVERWVGEKATVTEKKIQALHALVMANGKTKVAPSPYRRGQNVIRDGRTRAIVYMPPEAKDVAGLMKGLVLWLRNEESIPCPVVAGMAHYQFATIHPYYDGNGRTARLLTTLILQLGGYDLRGLYSLEEYYARHLADYYKAISLGPSHNYYMGRAETNITPWLEYFIQGMAQSFANVLQQMNEAERRGSDDQATLLRKLDPKQRKVLILFQKYSSVTASQIGSIFGFKPRTSAQHCKDWVELGFLEVVDPSKRGRKYRLARMYEELL